MFIHASDGAENGMNTILLRSVDTYIVVGISLSVWHKRLVVTVSGSIWCWHYIPVS